LLSLTYLSSAVDLWSDEDLAQLLRRARANNEKIQVTGMLLYSGGNFIQTLEGPDEAVDRLMTKVEADPRHTGVLVVRRDQVTDRLFSGWSMGFRHVTPDRAAEIPGFTDYLDTGRIDGATTRRHAVMTFHRVFREHIT
jgi:hypothetical protein